MFGRKGLTKLDPDTLESVSLAYLTALDEIEAMVATIKERLAVRATSNREELKSWHVRLVRIHTKALAVAQSLPTTHVDVAALAREAPEMDSEVVKIGETLWGADEARVSGFIMAAGILKSNV